MRDSRYVAAGGMIVKAFWLVSFGVIAFMAGCEMSAHKPKPARANADQQRAKAGPYIASTKQLSEHEELATVVIPSSIGPLLDQTCYIYRNRESKQSSFQCPADRPIELPAEN
jgi:hypothetical protein